MLLARMADLDRETPLSAHGNPTTYPDEFVKTHYRGTDIYGAKEGFLIIHYICICFERQHRIYVSSTRRECPPGTTV